MENNELADKLYTEYYESVGGVAFNGDPLPTWEEFSSDPAKEKQYAAWLVVAAVAAAAAVVVENEQKTLDVQSVADAKAKVSDIQVVGNGDTFALLCKASSKSQGWMKSAKAMEVPNGCVVQVTTQHGSNIAEALTFVPGVRIVKDVNGGRKLI